MRIVPVPRHRLPKTRFFAACIRAANLVLMLLHALQMHLAEIMYLLGPIPLELIDIGHYSHNWFDMQTGKLREKKINCKHDQTQIETRLRQTVPSDEIPLVAAMIRQALTYQPGERATASTLLNSDWLAQHVDAEARSP